MKWIVGFTNCPRCREPVLPTEDLFTVHEGEGGEAPWVPGLYHYRCFLAVPFRSAYLAAAGGRGRAFVEKQARMWKVLGKDQDFALVYKPLAEEYSVYFFRQRRELTFDSPSRLRRFWLGVVAHDGRPNPDAAGRVRWLPAPGGWLLAFREEV